jgi:hypothetical protein
MRLRRSRMRNLKTASKLQVEESHLKIHIQNVPAYSSSAKGTIEKFFSKLDSEFLQQVFDNNVGPNYERP